MGLDRRKTAVLVGFREVWCQKMEEAVDRSDLVRYTGPVPETVE